MSFDTMTSELLAEISSAMLTETPPPEIQAQLDKLRALRQVVVLWLIALGLAGFTITLLLVVTTIQDDVVRAEAELQTIQQQIERLGAPSAEVQALTATLTQTLAMAAALEAARPPQGIDWPAVMSQVGNYNSAQLTLTDLIQEHNRLTLQGAAVDSSVITQYRSQLEAATVFTRVVIQSIKTAEPTTSATAAPPAAAAMTVTFVIIIELRM